MSPKAKKAITGITISYNDGSSDTLDTYALVGASDSAWFKIMLSPARSNDKVEMNNMLVELSKTLLASIEQDK